MARVGYARVSTTDQHLEGQIERLGHIDKLFSETESGLDGSRPALAACRNYLREGDTLVITRIDRLARSTLHLCEIVDQLKRDNVELVVIDQAIDTTTSVGRLLFHVLAAIAQFETEIRLERQREGIAKAKEAGVYAKTRKLVDVDAEDLRVAIAAGASKKKLAQQYGVSVASIYRHLSDNPSTVEPLQLYS